ncbi:MAG: sodium-dependent transporter [Tannerella sp.]|jgi:NSS family neurotransmitter:Na+ symporter|nr:sodium-dependent transporter [Tannerella sp.]
MSNEIQQTGGRGTFGSRLGILLATVGSAVGLGNIWRFPYMLGANGGAAFLLIYIGCILLLGLPVMITEFFIGRHTQKNAAGAFKKLAPGTGWSVIGYNGVLAAFLILGFYYVISGWTLDYAFNSVTTSYAGKTAAEFTAEFKEFSSGIFRPLIWTLLFIAITHLVVVSGVKNGIERASKILMPMLFCILIALCIRSLTLGGAMGGIEFLFRPDFSKISPKVILDAMGQAFFSLSVGMGCLITYSSYFKKDTKLQRTALEVTVFDTFVALLGAVMIFPAFFHFHPELIGQSLGPELVGPELVFVTLPNVFTQLPLSNVWAFVFYVLLAVAALTSTISLHEVATAYIHEEHKVSRKRATLYVSIGAAVLCVFSSLSFGIMRDATVFGLTFFNLLDFVTAKLMLPFGGMLICIFVGNRVNKKILKAELTNEGTAAFYFFNAYYYFIKYLAPVAIGLIFLNELGLMKWLFSLG